MRVCLVCNQIAAWGKIGGFGTNARRLGRALADAGVDVHVVVPRRAGQGRVERLDGMTVHGQSSWEVLFGEKIYRAVDADIYHTLEPNLAGYRALNAMPGRVHLVTTMDPRESRDWWIELRHATWSRRCKYPMQRYYENSRLVHRLVRQADGVYAEVECIRDKARRLYGLAFQPEVLPKPIEIVPGPFKKSARPTCVFLGRFDPRKRPERFFQLVARMPDVDFIAVGRAHDRSYQRYLATRYFHLPNLTVTDLLDPFADDTLRRILSGAWILVHPAAREGLPTAFQEASVHEMGILAYVDPGGYVSRFGAVAPDDGSIESLATCLQTLIHSDAWRAKAKAGRQWNVERHATAVSVGAHLNVYHQKLGSRRKRSAA